MPTEDIPDGVARPASTMGVCAPSGAAASSPSPSSSSSSSSLSSSSDSDSISPHSVVSISSYKMGIAFEKNFGCTNELPQTSHSE